MDAIDKDTTVDKIWFKLTTYWNFLNYFLLEQVVCKFGDTGLKTSMGNYVTKLKAFRCETLLCDFAKCSAKISRNMTEDDFNLLAAKLNQNWEKCNLEDLENLTEKFTHRFYLPSFALTLKDIRPGCIHITWAIPAVIGASLKDNMENSGDISGFCKEHGITSLTIDGEECKYSAVKKYSVYLKGLYAHKEGKNLAPFKLATISKTPVDYDELTRCQDDLVYTRGNVDEHHIGIPTCQTEYKQPRCVLIEGAPGVGKTTFSEQFCYKWSQGQVLTNHRLLVLLPLRENRVRSARNVSDFFQHPELQRAIAEEVESNGGEGIALWLEAWDELGEEMRNQSSIFLDMLHGLVLPKATVIVTSRPWATEKLRGNASIKLDQHVGIVSTPNIQFSRILREDRVQHNDRAKFIDYVNGNPSVKAAMHTHVTADIIVEIFQWSRDREATLPTTMTQLYTAFTCTRSQER